MNKVILMGRLTRDPEVRYTQADTPLAITRYSLAVNRRYKRNGEAEVDFINCVAFGKAGEFAEKYFKKGRMVSIVGRLQNGEWTDKNGQKRYNTDVIVEEQYFADSKKSESTATDSGADKKADKKEQESAKRTVPTIPEEDDDGFFSIDTELEDDDLPF